MKRKFYVDTYSEITRETFLSPVQWPPDSPATPHCIRYSFEVEFPDPKSVELKATKAERE